MSVVVGVDLSSRGIDLVRLDEDSGAAWWERIDLPGQTAFDRLRYVRSLMPAPNYWDDVYLCAVEMGESRFTVSLRAQLPVFGAVVASIPAGVETWCVRPDEWKRPLGLAHNAKPTARDVGAPAGWGQDAWDALGVARYARDLNAAAVTVALKQSA